MSALTQTHAGAKVRASASTRLVEFLNRAPIHFALILISVLWLVPTLGLFVTSFRSRSDILTSGWWTALANPHFTLENYQRILSPANPTYTLLPNFINSVIITIPATVLPLVIGSLAAYAFAWLKFRGRDTIFLLIIALLIIPLQMTFVPILQLYNDPLAPIRALFALAGIQLDLPKILVASSYAGLWLAHTAYGLPFAIYLLRAFFATLPRDLFEAAKIDGSSEFGIFFRIVLPLSVPALAAFSIFQFLWVWNDLLVALIYAQGPNVRPLTVGVQSMLGTYAQEWDVLSAAGFLTMIVPLIVFFSLQKYFVTGLLAGSVKS